MSAYRSWVPRSTRPNRSPPTSSPGRQRLGSRHPSPRPLLQRHRGPHLPPQAPLRAAPLAAQGPAGSAPWKPPGHRLRRHPRQGRGRPRFIGRPPHRGDGRGAVSPKLAARERGPARSGSLPALVLVREALATGAGRPGTSGGRRSRQRSTRDSKAPDNCPGRAVCITEWSRSVTRRSLESRLTRPWHVRSVKRAARASHEPSGRADKRQRSRPMPTPLERRLSALQPRDRLRAPPCGSSVERQCCGCNAAWPSGQPFGGRFYELPR